MASSESAFTAIRSMIPDDLKFEYTSLREAVNRVRPLVDHFSPDRGYVCFSGVSRAVITKLDNALCKTARRKCIRFTYEAEQECLILRLAPGGEHEIPSHQFALEFASKVAEIPGHSKSSVISAGHTKFHYGGEDRSHGLRFKEGDVAFLTGKKRRHGFPSFVVEVGWGDLMTQEARWWLGYSEGATTGVLLIKLGTVDEERSMEFQFWKRSEAQGGEPYCDQSCMVDSAGGVTSSWGTLLPMDAVALTIPYEDVFREPHPSSTDITYTADELSSFALSCFGAS